MERIIAGRFETQAGADAAAALIGQYVDTYNICVFYNSPPGQQLASESTGQFHEDHGSDGAGKSAATTAVAAGLAAGAVGMLGGPIVALAAAGVGAYAGSLAGALGGMGNQEVDPLAPEHRKAGVMLSIRIGVPTDEERVIATLRSEGAADIELAQGEWFKGDWTDFDPLAAPHLVGSASG
jgi:hypothetical protein